MPASTLLNKQMMYQMKMKWIEVLSTMAIIIIEMAVLPISASDSCQTRASRIYFKINLDNKINLTTTSRPIFSTKIIMTPITSA